MQQCARCGLYYDESTNVGRWQCRAHIGPWDAQTCTFKCCGLRPDVMPGLTELAAGCRAVDHDLETLEENPAMLLPDRRLYFGIVRAYHKSRLEGIHAAAIRYAPTTTTQTFVDALVQNEIADAPSKARALAARIAYQCLLQDDYWRVYDNGGGRLLKLTEGEIEKAIKHHDPSFFVPEWRASGNTLEEIRRRHGLYPEQVEQSFATLLTALTLPKPALAIVARVDWDHPIQELVAGVNAYEIYFNLVRQGLVESVAKVSSVF
jgi:hypothetical protein